MIYFVKYRVDCRTYVKVEADNPKEALEKSENEVMMDKYFNDIEDVEYEPIYVEDEDGNIVEEVS